MRSYRELFLESREDEPSYEDIIVLQKLRDPSVKVDKEDEISEDEYNSYSQEEKELKHQARKFAEVLEKTKGDETPLREIPKIAQVKAASFTDDDEEVYLVHYYETSFKWGQKPDVESHFMDSRTEEMLNDWMPGTYVLHNCDVEVLPSMEDAKQYIFKRINEAGKKTGVTSKDFKVYSGADIPEEIKKVDPKAIALKYVVLEGERGVPDDYNSKGEQSFYEHDGEIKTPVEWAKTLKMQPQLFRKYLRNGQLTGYKRVNQDGSEYEAEMEWKTITKDDRYAYWIVKTNRKFLRGNEYGQLLQKIEDTDIGISNEAAANLVQAIADLDLSWTERGDRTREKQEKKREERERYRDLSRTTKDLEKDIEDEKRKQSDPYKFDDDDAFDLENPDDDLDDQEDREADEYGREEYGDDYEDRQSRASDYYDSSDDMDGSDADYVPSWDR